MVSSKEKQKVKASDIFTKEEIAKILELKTLFNGKVVKVVQNTKS